MMKIAGKLLGRSSLMLGLLGVVPVMATPVSIPIQNYSFESPRVNTAFLPVSLTVDNWTTQGPAGNYVNEGSGPQNSGTGIFPNANNGGGVYFTNADDGTGGTNNNPANAQVAYLFTNSSEGVNNEFIQTLSTNFLTGQYYKLTVAAANDIYAPTPTDTLNLTLFYTTPGGDPTVPADRVVVLTQSFVSSSLPSELNGLLADVSASSTAPLSDVNANGQPINVLISTVGVGGGEIDVDNVRLTADTPEPASLGLVGMALAVLGVRRRRRGTL